MVYPEYDNPIVPMETKGVSSNLGCTKDNPIVLRDNGDDGAGKKRKYQEDTEGRKQRREKEEVYMMKTSSQGKAVLAVTEILTSVKRIKECEPELGKYVDIVATDDLIPITMTILGCQAAFLDSNIPAYIDIGYHYTEPESLTNIQINGLLTKKDRAERGAQSRNRGSFFGDGIYTANHPTSFSNYGSVGLLVGRLQGKSIRVLRRKVNLHDIGINTVIGNKGPTRAQAPHHLTDEVVLQSSSQCLPIIKYNKELLQHEHGVQYIQKIEKSLQRILDQHFNEGVPIDMSVPPLLETMITGLQDLVSAAWSPVHCEDQTIKSRRALVYHLESCKEEKRCSFAGCSKWKSYWNHYQKCQKSWCSICPKPSFIPTQPPSPAIAHEAAARGELQVLKALGATNKKALFLQDANDWRPFHEAARSGHVDILHYLIMEGASVNERANNGTGGSPLWWAERDPRKNEAAIKLLKHHGALSIQPGALTSRWETLSYIAPQNLTSGIPADALQTPPANQKETEACVICYEALSKHPCYALNVCSHTFHTHCIRKSFDRKPECPICRSVVSEPQGKSPSGEMEISIIPGKCVGFPENTIRIIYTLAAGPQKIYHENPLQLHSGKRAVAYLPNNKAGNQLLKRLKYAFLHGLTFTVGTSATSGRTNQCTWASIHHKTSLHGGTRLHGFPDPNYFVNCNKELDSLHVPQANLLQDNGKKIVPAAPKPLKYDELQTPPTQIPPIQVPNPLTQGSSRPNSLSCGLPPSQAKRSPCNCKRSKCLKLYCECFAAERFCDGCNCTDCANTPTAGLIRHKAIMEMRANDKISKGKMNGKMISAPSPMTASKSRRLSQAKPKKTQAEVEKDFADAFVKAFLYAGRFQSAPAIWCGPTASKVPNPLSQRCSLPKRASTLSAMPSKGSAPSFTPAHMAAACGNLEVLKGLGALDKSNLFLRDSNDWTPLHLAARGGHADVLEYLISESGSHLINIRTNNGIGPSALWLAEKDLKKNKEAIRVLKKGGAISLAPTTLTFQFL